jgi:chromate reductase
MKKKILALSGSTRSNSANVQLLHFISDLSVDKVEIEIDHSMAELPFFNPDAQELPSSVLQFLNKIKSADGIIICTPEYVFSIPGMLKNALEWTVSTAAFSRKPVALITASSLGEIAHESLALIMKTLEAEYTTDTSILIQGVRGKINKEGIVSDEETIKRINKMLDAFISQIDIKQKSLHL